MNVSLLDGIYQQSKKNTILICKDRIAISDFNQDDEIKNTFYVNEKVFNQSLNNGFIEIILFPITKKENNLLLKAIWAVDFRGINGNEYSSCNTNGIVNDSFENIYTIGDLISTTSNVNISKVLGLGQTSSGYILPQKSDTKMDLVKYDKNGQVLWANYLDTSVSSNGYGLSVDSSNNIYTTGEYVSSSNINIKNVSGTGQVDSGYFLPATISNTNAYLIKYNTNGQVIWSVGLDETKYFSSGKSVIVDNSDNVYFSGMYSSNISNINLKNASGTGQVQSSYILSNTRGIDCFLIKYNYNGQVQWSTNFGSDTTQDYLIGSCVDKTNNIYICGSYRNLTGQLVLKNASGTGQTPSSYTLPSHNSNQGYLVKYNSNGQVQWGINLNVNDYAEFDKVSSDSDGNIYVVGSYISSGNRFVREVSGTGQVDTSFVLPPTLNESNTVVIKYNSSGKAQWVLNLNKEAYNYTYSVKTDNSGNIYLTGNYITYNEPYNLALPNVSGTGQVDSEFTLAQIYEGGYLIKYNTNGQVQYANQLMNNPNDAKDVCIKSNHVYVAGNYSSDSETYIQNSNLTTQEPSNITLPYKLTIDPYIIKYEQQ